MAIIQKGVLLNSPLANRWMEDYGQRHRNCVNLSLHFAAKEVRFTTALSLNGRVSILNLDGVVLDVVGF